MGDDAASADGGASANGDAGADDCAATKPDVIADGDGEGIFPAFGTFCGVEGMGGGVDLNFGAEQAAVTEVDGGAVEDDAVKVDVEVVACLDVAAIVAAEVRADFAIAADAAEEGLDEGLLAGGVGWGVVD